MKGLNLGCGPIYLQGPTITWENSDFADSEASRGWTLDKKRDFLDLSDVESDSIDFIVAWHIVEHIPMHLLGDTLKQWYRVLKPGGDLYIACPDVTKIARHIIDRDGPWADWFICMVNVYGPYNGFVGDLHRWGYDHSVMVNKLMEAGFNNTGELNPHYLWQRIGARDGQKLGFADYNLQVYATK